MKKLYTSIAFFVCFLISNAQTVADPNEAPSNGIWLSVTSSTPKTQLTSILNSPDTSKFKGVFVAYKWSDIEPSSPGVFNFSALDTTLTIISGKSRKIALIIYAGPDAPHWLYTNAQLHVPYYWTDLDTAVTDPALKLTFPEYTDTTYKKRWQLMLQNIVIHISTLSAPIKSNLELFQSAEGSTGDEGPFKGNCINCTCSPNCTSAGFPYNADSSKWISFRENGWQYLNAKLQTYLPGTTLLVNPGNPTSLITTYTQYLSNSANHLQNAWLKAGGAGHGYQLNDEVAQKGLYDPFINNTTGTNCATQVRSRSEMAEDQTGWFQEAPKWNFYWTALSGLHFGLDLWMNTYNFLSDTNYAAAFPIFNKYAGLKGPACTDKGFCALRDGLDASDFTRFPASLYGGIPGTTTANNYTARAKKIIDSFKIYGARQEDTSAALGSGINQRQAKGLNDVGFSIFSGNYERYIHEVYATNPAPRFRGGLWRVDTLPGTKPNDPYGRYAKGFDTVNNVKDFYFDISDNLAIDSLEASTRKAHIHIVYYCNAPGKKFQLQYYAKDSGNRTFKTATVTTSQTPGWQTFDKDINKLYINNGITAANADLELHYMNADYKTMLAFHLIEISNQPGQAANRIVSNTMAPIGKLTIYPNPGSGVFNVKCPGTKTISNLTVFDARGQKLFDRHNIQQDHIKLDLTSKTAGIYFVQVTSGKNVFMSKIVKE